MKRKVFSFSGEVLKAMLSEGNEQHFRVINGIPKEAKIVQSGANYMGSQDFAVFYLTLEWDGWPEVPEGSVMDPITPLVEKVNCGL